MSNNIFENFKRIGSITNTKWDYFKILKINLFVQKSIIFLKNQHFQNRFYKASLSSDDLK